MADEYIERIRSWPPRPYAGCKHMAAGAIDGFDWRYTEKRLCECCGRPAIARHPTKRRRVRCEDCGGIVRPKGVAADRERWVIEIEV
jgi:hypothetical protein